MWSKEDEKNKRLEHKEEFFSQRVSKISIEKKNDD